MIHVKDHKTHCLFNPFEHLGPKRLALLESSWAHLFREEILHVLPVEKLFPVYSKFTGRKTKELYAMLGVVLLQQMEDLTDEETVRQVAFNIMWQYALNITDASDVSSYVAPRTLWAMRDTVGRLGLEQELFGNITESLRKLFALDPSRQRLDSVHIFSNMAHLGRIRLFSKTIRKFLVNLKRHHAALYHELGELAIRYEAKNDGQFAVKPSESAKTLQCMGDDCFSLVERFKANVAVCAMSSYQLLSRLFSEQCVVNESQDGPAVQIKPNKEVRSDSLQNPSDPDAGYSGHKGKGYQMQVMETYSPDKTQPNLITHVEVEAAHKSDAHALIPAITGAMERELAPVEVLADTLYGGDDNIDKAKALDVAIVAPAPGAPSSHAISLGDFIFDGADDMTACPEGQKPVRIKTGKRQGRIVHFNPLVCDQCARQRECPVKRAKLGSSIAYDAKALRLARRRVREKTAAFRETYRFRAGIEGTMSDLDRLTGLKHLRVRGMPKVRVAAVLKATGLNILRATAFRNRRKNGKPMAPRPNVAQTGAIGAFKEQMSRCLGSLRQLGKEIIVAIIPADYYLALAA